jgi:hypothetical protein
VGVELGEAEELVVSQTRQDPLFDPLYAVLRVSLVSRLGHPCRNHGDAVELGHVRIVDGFQNLRFFGE